MHALEPGMREVVEDYVEVDDSVELLDDLLKTLKSECQSDDSVLLAMNLGDFLNTHDDKIRFDGPFYPIPGKAKNVILQYMIDNLPPDSLGFKLNELDASRKTLLQTAAEQIRLDCFALLLANGADPSVSSVGGLKIRNMLVKSARFPALGQMRNLLDFREFCRLGPNEYISVAPWRGNNFESRSIRELQRDPKSWLSLADPGADGLTWIHVPSTNGLTIMAIFRVLASHDSTRETYDFMRIFSDHFRPSTVAPGDPFLNYRDVSYLSEKIGRQRRINCSIIVFPSLALSTIRRHKAARAQHESIRKTLSPETFGKYSADYSIHLERTLDEAYYLGLSSADLEFRNKDQVVSRMFRKAGKEAPILMVPQLWLWKVGGLIISAYSMTRESEIFQKWKYRSGEQKGARWKPRISSNNADLQLTEILASLIYSFGQECDVEGVKYPPALDVFEKSVVSVLSEASDYMNTTKPSSINYNKERYFLHALSDIRDELVMIKHVLKQQEEVLGMMSNDDTIDWPPSLKWGELPRAGATLMKYQQRIAKIDGDAERIEKTVHDMLNLKRTYASVKDSHSSVILSTAVIGFTVITIIFAPLMFLTALFALKIDGFEKLQLRKTSGIYDPLYIGGIFVGSEILTIALTVLAVTVSLWYIKRWDQVGENHNAKPLRKEVVVRRSKQGSKKSTRRVDLESHNEMGKPKLPNATRDWLQRFLCFIWPETTPSHHIREELVEVDEGNLEK